MKEIWRTILQHPELLLLLGFWAISMLGGLLTRSARRAAERQRSQRAEGTGQPTRAPAPRAERRSGGQDRMDPEEIARQIRRAMGLEREEDARPSPRTEREARVRVEEPPPPPVVVVSERPKGLSEQMAERAKSDKVRAERLSRERRTRLGDDVRSRTLDHLQPHIVAPKRRISHRGMTRVVDLRRPAIALVAMEILGPPVALRDPAGHPFRAR